MKSKEALQYVQTRDAIKWGFEITPAKANLSPVMNKWILAGMQWIQEVDPNLSPVKWSTDVFNLRNPSVQTSSFFFPQPELPYNPFRQQQTPETGVWKDQAILSIARKFYETWSVDTKDLEAMGITPEEFRQKWPKLYIESKKDTAKQSNFQVTNENLLLGKSAKEMSDIFASLPVADEMIKKLDRFNQLFNQYWVENIPGKVRWEMEQLHTDITLNLKNKAAWYDLWVLNGKDREILVRSFPEITGVYNPKTRLNLWSKIKSATDVIKSKLATSAAWFWLKYSPWLSNQTKDNPLWLNMPWTTSSNKDPLSIF